MVINNVRIFLHHGESNLKATVTVLVNNQILLQSIRIFQDAEAEGEKSKPWSFTSHSDLERVEAMRHGKLMN